MYKFDWSNKVWDNGFFEVATTVPKIRPEDENVRRGRMMDFWVLCDVVGGNRLASNQRGGGQNCVWESAEKHVRGWSNKKTERSWIQYVTRRHNDLSWTCLFTACRSTFFGSEHACSLQHHHSWIPCLALKTMSMLPEAPTSCSKSDAGNQSCLSN